MGTWTNFFKRSPITGGGKDAYMAEPNAPATPPAASGGPPSSPVDVEALKTELRTEFASAIAEAMKPVGVGLAELQKGQQALAEAAGKAIRPEDVSKAVAEAVKAQTAVQAADAAKATFIAAKLTGVPAAYYAKLGADPAKWPAEEQAIRAELQADLAKLGVKATPVDGAAGTAGAGKPGQAVDTSKLSAVQLMELGLGESSPIGASARAATAAAETAPTTPAK